MARAKQTNRAEARRRYRQTALDPVLQETDDDAPATPAATTRTPATSGRPGFGASLRRAYHPPNVREDIRALPSLLLTVAFLLPAVLIVLSAGAFVAFPGYNGSTLAWEVVVLPGNGFAAAVIAGFLTRRASYLLGFILGIEQAIAYAITIPLAAAALGQEVDNAAFSSVVLVGAVAGPIGSLLWASGAAWYRRFLAATSARRQTGRPGAKTKAGAKAAAKSGARR